MKNFISTLLVVVLVFCLSGSTFAAGSTAIASANTLYTLELFKGIGSNSDNTPIYDLDRAPTRSEAITMLVRLLGKEDVAETEQWNMPFNDVAAWAAPYVGYAYDCGLTLGTSPTKFSGNDKVSASQYITFVLRALGYSSETDFTWNKAWVLSDQLGLTDGEYNTVSLFSRGDIALLSRRALSQNMKSNDTRLLAYLWNIGAVTTENVRTAGLFDLLTRSALSAREISAKISPAVFYLKVYKTESDYNSNAHNASGSGFFISNTGVAVTNYHVIKDTARAVAVTIDGKQHLVESVLYYDDQRDIAVISVSKTADSGTSVDRFSNVDMVSQSSVRSGDIVYSIGSPLGLQNSISSGIVSSPDRTLNGEPYSFIQNTAPISPGNSGGVLLNEYGEAIGITSATILEGQSINLAVPLDMILMLDLTIIGLPYGDS